MKTRLHTHKETNDIEVIPKSRLVLTVHYRLQKDPHIVIQFFQMNRVGIENVGVFIPIVQMHVLQTSLGRVYGKTPTWGVMWEATGGGQISDVSAVEQHVSHGKHIVPCSETADPCISFNRNAKISDCYLRTMSFKVFLVDPVEPTDAE